ncbi:MAG: bis(5'-nucleosyl)-tetraphosphatase (symmetrical) YqeK [Lachnospiraceae bacterium]|nr:bis(5'-nucleosyl)-tetraphosphatase (symmetrical) YqeK [Lachnospiraceae bacterium]
MDEEIKGTEAVSLKKLRRHMEQALKPDRFEHSLGVAYTAASLAMRFDADVRKALTAGILHDCAKGLDHEEQLKICKKNGIEITAFEERNKKLLHAKAGAWLAEHKYGITDPEILSAIRWHTTGRPGMTALEKIVFLADIIEPHRKPFAYGRLDEIRHAVFEDLDRGLCLTLTHLLEYLRSQSEELDPTTEETWRFYCRDEQK